MSRTLGAALAGVDGVGVEVEVRISSLLPRVDIVGLPEAAVRESAGRVRAAINAAGHRFPERRVTVNLAPAELRKTGAALDLPIAIGILKAANSLPDEGLGATGFIGELALDGRLRGVRGALSLVLALKQAGCRDVVVPALNAREASFAPGVEIFAARNLTEALEHLAGAKRLPPVPPLHFPPDPPDTAGSALLEKCLRDVRGQESAKRALEIAAAGGHGLLLTGPPGSGKTMLACRLAGLLPPLSFEEALEATRIHSTAGLLPESEPIVTQRPFRAPHHTASTAGLMGGGNPPGPGEVSLAHRGVLFLDELLEFERRSLESLRQVLEERRVRISRARHTCVFPADFVLVAACNPCPCGWYRSGRRDCRCDDAAIQRYRRRVSGPLLDRIDMHVGVDPVPWRDLARPPNGPSSLEVRNRVLAARAHQRKRGHSSNAEIPDRGLEDFVAPSAEAHALLGRAVDRFALSARAARRVLRVARTIADLDGAAETPTSAIAEALSYRDESTEN